MKDITNYFLRFLLITRNLITIKVYRFHRPRKFIFHSRNHSFLDFELRRWRLRDNCDIILSKNERENEKIKFFI